MARGPGDDTQARPLAKGVQELLLFPCEAKGCHALHERATHTCRIEEQTHGEVEAWARDIGTLDGLGVQAHGKKPPWQEGLVRDAAVVAFVFGKAGFRLGSAALEDAADEHEAHGTVQAFLWLYESHAAKAHLRVGPHIGYVYVRDLPCHGPGKELLYVVVNPR